MNIRKTWPYLFSILAGLCDSSTGLMLVLAPEFTLRLMGIPNMPSEPVYMRFIGAFVLSVGSSYLIPFLVRDAAWRRMRLEGVLFTTAIIRMFIATFTTLALLKGWLALAWVSVPLIDITLATVQILILEFQLLDHAHG